MKTTKSTIRMLALWLTAAVGCAAILVACGGGSGSGSSSRAGVGSGGTGSAVFGTITGFGSVILNGVRFDDSVAQITLDDDNNNARDIDLRLGMTVEVEGDMAAGGTTGKATSIVGRSFVQGPVSAINVANNQLTVLGVTVNVTAQTAYDGAGVTGLSALGVNDVVEIYGLPDGAQALKATRIERISNTSESRLTGTVQNVTATTFTINGITVQYQPANLIGMPSGVSAGTIVRVKGSLLNPTTIIANKVRQVGLTAALKENQYVELEGVVTSFTSATNFEINGLKVSVAASGTIEGTPAPGSRAQVEGTVANGILVASRVQIQDENQPQPDANEVHAQISSIDNANKILTVRNGTITIRWDNNTVFDSSLPNGAGSLTVGLQIDVDGKMTGNELLASQIGLDTQQ